MNPYLEMVLLALPLLAGGVVLALMARRMRRSDRGD